MSEKIFEWPAFKFWPLLVYVPEFSDPFFQSQIVSSGKSDLANARKFT